MTELLAVLTLAAEKAPEEEGRDIIIAMLVVGLIFLGVVVVGELTKWLSHRRRRH
jgi:hypothetical protein